MYCMITHKHTHTQMHTIHMQNKPILLLLFPNFAMRLHYLQYVRSECQRMT